MFPLTLKTHSILVCSVDGIILQEFSGEASCQVIDNELRFGWPSSQVGVDLSEVNLLSHNEAVVKVDCETTWRQQTCSRVHLCISFDSIVEASKLVSAVSQQGPVGTVSAGQSTVSPTRFYGMQNGDQVKVKQPAERGVFERFFRQQAAFDYQRDARNSGRGGAGDRRLLVLSYEDPGDCGRRRFACASLGAFWSIYMQLPPTERHFYEIIPEGVPCRLYLDVEFSIPANHGLDGNAMVAFLLGVVANGVLQRFGLLLSESDFLVLDSTVPGKKFSKHIIGNFPGGALFSDNRECGTFVRDVVEAPSVSRALQVRRTCDSDRTSSIVDLGVYTRNRAFRLCWSSKYGKAKILDLDAAFNRFPGSDDDDAGTRKLFDASLVCPPWDTKARILTLPPGLSTASAGNRIGGTSTTAALKGPTSRVPPTDFPLLDAFAVRVASSNAAGKTAKISRYSLEQKANDLVLNYFLSGNRFCYRIGRAHKSNNVYLVVRSKRGGMTTIAQRCWDPDCRGFQSDGWQVPEDVAQSLWPTVPEPPPKPTAPPQLRTRDL